MTKTKYTKRDKFNALLTILNERNSAEEIRENLTIADLIEFAEHEIDLLANKNLSPNGEKKLTDKQKENIAIGENVLAYLLDSGEKLTITQIIKAVDGLPSDMTNQRMTHIVSDLVKDNKVVKTIEKRVSYFSAV